MMTAAAKAIRAKVGDVFRIPIGEGECVLGQVVDKAGPQHMVVVFRAVGESVDTAFASGIDLAGIVFDAKLRNGDWPILKNVPPVQVKAPLFVLGHDGLENLRLETFDGKETRLVRPAEAGKHRHRNISYPMVLQRAASAIHGREAWKADFDHFRDLGAEMRVS